MIQSIFAYFRKLTESESRESSKRFLAVYVTLALVSYVVIAYTNDKNCEFILGELLSFVLVLMGVAVWQSVKNRQIESKGQENKIGADEEY